MSNVFISKESFRDGDPWLETEGGKPPATGATAGYPGTWTPPGSAPPLNITNLNKGIPVTVIASPTSTWLNLQFVQTQTAGTQGRAHWSGSAWVAGSAVGVDEEVAPR